MLACAGGKSATPREACENERDGPAAPYEAVLLKDPVLDVFGLPPAPRAELTFQGDLFKQPPGVRRASGRLNAAPIAAPTISAVVVYRLVRLLFLLAPRSSLLAPRSPSSSSAECKCNQIDSTQPPAAVLFIRLTELTEQSVF